ncbi:MAG TPA: hypothetical protein VK841_08935 [Polyangiaceae bacterium]|nr:hypothetical protein [Polyangiaceae bacterium]
MTATLARSLLTADAITPEILADVLFVAATERLSLVRALVTSESVDPDVLQRCLDRDAGEGPYMRHIAPVLPLVERLPGGLCDRLFALPVRSDAHTKTIDIAVVDALDPHPLRELGHWLAAPVRAVRTSVATMESALAGLSDPSAPGFRALGPPIAAPLSDEEEMAVLDSGWTDEDLLGPLSTPRRTRAPAARTPARTRGWTEAPPPLPARGPSTAPHPEPRVSHSHPPSPFPPLGSFPPPPHPSSGARPRARESLPPPSPGTPPTRAGTRTSQPPSFAATLSDLRIARERDRILADLVARARGVSARVVLLAVHRDGLLVWSGPEGASETATLKGMRIENDLRTVFGDALASAGTCFGRLAPTAEYAGLVEALGGADVAMVTARVEHRPVAILLASGFADAFTAADCLRELAREAGESLRTLLRRRHP